MAIVLTGIVSPTDTDAPLAAPTRITMTNPIVAAGSPLICIKSGQAETLHSADQSNAASWYLPPLTCCTT